MVDWRRIRRESEQHQEITRTPTRLHNKGHPPVSWHQTVPAWEKKFCFLVGSISWKKLLEAKKLISYYQDVVQWNDSAGEEAFHNAKCRFWEEINGLPCSISLPDPDVYIDQIDWNSHIDPGLLLDLECEPDINFDEEEAYGKLKLCDDSFLYLNQPVPCTGWGDSEEGFMKNVNDISLGSPSLEGCGRNSDNGNNSWECGNETLKDKTYENDLNNSWDLNCWENANNGAVKDNTWENCGANLWEMNAWETNNNWVVKEKTWENY